MNQYFFLAYVISLGVIIGVFSIIHKSETGMGFAGGIVSGSFGAMQIKKENE